MMQVATPDNQTAHVIVVGNEKGGSGKTTTSMHLIIGLLKLGFRVGSMDIDSRQKSLSRYLENRQNYSRKHQVSLSQPTHQVVVRSPFSTVDEMEEDEHFRFTESLRMLARDHDFVVIDSPGSDMYLSRLAHSMANTVITPINDSFIDLDVLAHVNAETSAMERPSIYSEMLWEQKMNRARRGQPTMDWIVMRNRLSNLDARNKRRMADVVEHLGQRIGFRVAPGFGERVIFRELFLEGLTVMDLDREQPGVSLSMSHIAAREEVRQLLKTLGIPKILDAMQASGKPGGRKSERAKPSSQPAPVTERSAEGNSACTSSPTGQGEARSTAGMHDGMRSISLTGHAMATAA